ncbi:MAG: chemotaxis protein CheW [Desulfosoma sp.]
MIGEEYVVFEIDGQSCAVPLRAVRRIVRAAALSPVPDAPRGLLGLLNLHGCLIPVYDMREALGYPPKPLAPQDRFLIVDDGSGPAALCADEVRHIGNVQVEPDIQGRRLLGHQRLFGAVGQCNGKTVFIVDPASLGKGTTPSHQGVKGNDDGVMKLTFPNVAMLKDGDAVGVCL